MAALWGGTTPPWTKAEVRQYLKSLDYFTAAAKSKKVDVALSNHTAIDNGLERIAYSRKRLPICPTSISLGRMDSKNIVRFSGQ